MFLLWHCSLLFGIPLLGNPLPPPPTLVSGAPSLSHSRLVQPLTPQVLSSQLALFFGRQALCPSGKGGETECVCFPALLLLSMGTAVELRRQRVPSGREWERGGSSAWCGLAGCCRKGTSLILLVWWIPWHCGNMKLIHN